MSSILKIPFGAAILTTAGLVDCAPSDVAQPVSEPQKPAETEPYVPQMAVTASETAVKAIEQILLGQGFKLVGEMCENGEECSRTFVFVDSRYNRVTIGTRKAFYRDANRVYVQPNPEMFTSIRAETVLGMTVVSEYFDRPVFYGNVRERSRGSLIESPAMSVQKREELLSLSYIARVNVAVRMLEIVDWKAIGDNLNMALRGNETARYWAEEANGTFVVRENPLAWREQADTDASSWQWFKYTGAKNAVVKNHRMSYSITPGTKVGLRGIKGNRARLMVPSLGDKSTFTLGENTARNLMSRLEKAKGRPPAPHGSQPKPRPAAVAAAVTPPAEEEAMPKETKRRVFSTRRD